MGYYNVTSQYDEALINIIGRFARLTLNRLFIATLQINTALH